MGNIASSFDPRYVRIWHNLATLQSNETRISMLETLMAGPEYVAAAKKAGVYAHILQWIASMRRGEPVRWPWAVAGTPQAQVPSQVQPQRPVQHPTYQHPIHDPQRISAMTPPRKEQPVANSSALATVPPPKRALDALHEAYMVLGLDDTKPLSHEALRLAYKKAAARAHPDRGGTSEGFDRVTRAFLYVEEVLNKLVPKGATDGEDPRFTQKVTKEAALQARNVPLSKYAEDEAARRDHFGNRDLGVGAGGPTLRIEEKPPVTLNPKKLDMNVFNQLFEENRLPDPDQDGYGDWLRSNGEDGKGRTSQQESALRAKFNAEVFNRAFVSEAKKDPAAAAELARYRPPDELVHHQGTELGGGRPKHFISPMGANIAYTDLKFAYGEGSTFSQDVAHAPTESGKTFTQMKAEREAAPKPLSAEEAAMVAAVERQRAAAEEERRRRLAVADVAAEDVYSKLQRRLMIQ